MTMVIALDGPAGAGKSTVARGLAQQLDLIYFDSGAVYRLFTLLALEHIQGDSLERVDDSLIQAVQRAMPHIEIVYNNDQPQVFYRGQDLTPSLRSENVARNIHIIAGHGSMRDLANGLIHSFGRDNSLVIDGRDIGTVVFPDTPYKFYLDASPEERARRRYQQLLADPRASEEGFSLEQVEKDMRQRDYLDQNRELAPLKQAKDAVYINSDGLTLAEVVSRIYEHIQVIRRDIGG